MLGGNFLSTRSEPYPWCMFFPLHLFIPSPIPIFISFFHPLTLNTLAQYGNGIIKLSTGCKYLEGRRIILAQYGNGIIKLFTGCKYLEGRRRILAQYGNGIIKLSTVCKYLEGRRRILAQYGNGIIKLSTESKYFRGKKKNTCTIWQWNNQIIHRE